MTFSHLDAPPLLHDSVELLLQAGLPLLKTSKDDRLLEECQQVEVGLLQVDVQAHLLLAQQEQLRVKPGDGALHLNTTNKREAMTHADFLCSVLFLGGASPAAAECPVGAAV